MNAREPIDSRTKQSFMLIFGILASGIVTAALGFLALLGWVLELPLLAGFGADLMPMAPGTAVLFLWYGAAICLRARTPLSRRAFWVSLTAGCLGALVALLLFTLACLNIHWAAEHLGLNATRMVRGASTGHMSPVTAFCFLVVGMSFLASLSRSATRPWRAVLALGSAGVLLGTSFTFMLVYLYGAPLLYGGTLIPPALNTVLAFVMLGLALLALVGWPVGLFDGSLEESSRTVFAFHLIFVLLAAGIVTTGYIYYRSYEQKYRAQVERQLSAIAELKVGELTQYRNERLGDAAILFQNAPLSALVRRFLEKPEDADAQRQLQTWLGKYQARYQYDRAFLLDAQGVTRMAAPEAPEPVGALISQRVSELLRSGQVAFQDFYRNEHSQRVYLALLVPILDESDAGRPLGVVVLRIDPTTYLYPFIKRWPTPSLTAETLLVRKEGNEVVFLNELRFQTKTALNLRTPLDRIAMPAVQAALGREGIMEGIDYRGVPVVAALHTIPDSPWALVARMDAAEVKEPLRERLWQMVLLIGALLLGAGGCVGLIWRQQRVRFYRERAELAQSLRASEVRYRRLFEAAKDGILILDAETGVILDVNPFLTDLLGYAREAFLGTEVWELGSFKDIVANQAHFAELQLNEYIRYDDKPLVTCDGRRIEVEFVSNVYLVNHLKVIQCNIRDITERKRAEAILRESEARLRASKDMLQAIVDNTPALVYVFDRAERLSVANKALGELLGRPPSELLGKGRHEFLLQEIAGRNEANDRQVIEAGGPRQFEETGTFQGRTTTFLTVRFPLRDEHGAIRGVGGISTDITERKRAEEALRESEKWFRILADTTSTGIFIYQGERFVYANRANVMLSGYTAEEFLALCLWDLIHPDCWELVRERGLARRRGEPVTDRYEVKILRKDGEERWIDFTAGKIDWQGRPAVLGTAFDITDRKRAEEALQYERDFAESMIETAQTIVMVFDTQARIVRFNRYMEEISGYALAEVQGKDWFTTFLPEGARERFRILFLKAIGDVQTRGTVNPIVTKDGSEREIEWYDKTLKDVQGNVIGLLSIGHDVTDRKRADAALSQAKDDWEDAFNSITDMITVHDNDFNIIHANKAARQILGLPLSGDKCDAKCFKHFHGTERPPAGCPSCSCLTTGLPSFYELFEPHLNRYLEILAIPRFDRNHQLIGLTHVARDITARKRAEESMRELALQLSRVQGEERRRIARELHDSTGQKLAALSMTVGLLQDAAGDLDGKTNKMLADCLTMIEECAQEIRTISYLLHPPLLDELGLAAAIRNYVEGFSKRSGVQVTFDTPHGLERFPAEVELTLFRIVQESLGNIHRHADASNARICLACDAEQVMLEVSDPGRGMSGETIRAIEAGRGSTGVGIAGMRERLRLLGGRLEIESGGQGTTVRAIIPRRQEPT